MVKQSSKSSKNGEVLLYLQVLQWRLYNMAAMGPAGHSHTVDLPKEWIRDWELKEIAFCRPPARLLWVLKDRQWEGKVVQE